MMKTRVLVINDTPEMLALYQAMLGEEEYVVSLHSFGPPALAAIKRARPDLLILDFIIGQEGTGWQLLQMVKMDRETAGLPILICSGAVRQLRELDGWLGQKGIVSVLKPFDIEDLQLAVEKALRRAARHAEP